MENEITAPTIHIQLKSVFGTVLASKGKIECVDGIWTGDGPVARTERLKSFPKI